MSHEVFSSVQNCLYPMNKMIKLIERPVYSLIDINYLKRGVLLN